MDRLYRQVSHVSKLHFRHDDDIADRMNYLYTCTLLVIFSIINSNKQYVGDAIQCWTPAHFKSSHDKYTNDVCWVANTYWLPLRDTIPDYIPEREQRELGYYQYVPLVLLLQAMLFYLPCLVWRSLNGLSGLNMKSLIQSAMDVTNASPECKMKTIRYLGRHIELSLESQREYRSGCSVRVRQRLARQFCLFCGRRYGNYLIWIYMIAKFLYLINIIGELYMFNIFLGTNYTLYGFEVLADLIRGKDWKASGVFPRVTMCDFEVRRLGSTHRYTVQCVLPINLFNEKMYVFLWFWFCACGVVTCYSIFNWLSYMLFSASRKSYIKKYLKILDQYNKTEMKLVDRFAIQYLRHDGVLVLRLITINAGDFVTSEVINVLWSAYRSKPGFKEATLGKGWSMVKKSLFPNPKKHERDEDECCSLNGDTPLRGAPALKKFLPPPPIYPTAPPLIPETPQEKRKASRRDVKIA